MAVDGKKAQTTARFGQRTVRHAVLPPIFFQCVFHVGNVICEEQKSKGRAALFFAKN